MEWQRPVPLSFLVSMYSFNMPLLFLETSVFRYIFQICQSSLGLWVFLFSGTACGVLVPQPGTEPRDSAVNVQKER